MGSEPRTVSELPSGPTNDNCKIVTPPGSCLVRIAGASSELLVIDRDNERAVAGFGSPALPGPPDDAAQED
jgi:hypothetical protein